MQFVGLDCEAGVAIRMGNWDLVILMPATSLLFHKVLAFQGIAVMMLPVGAEHTVAVTESGSLGCLLYL